MRKALLLAHFAMPGIFSLMVDTTTTETDFKRRTLAYDPSAHSFNETLAPYWELDSFDIWLEDVPLNLDIKADKMHFLRMGRPGWYFGEEIDHSTMVHVARNKLNGDDTSNSIGECAKVAALSCVLGIPVVNKPALAEKLCRSHMAFLTFVGEFQEKITVKYRSEPMLVFGAYKLLNLKRNEKRLFEDMTNLLAAGYIPGEARGEIIARMILLQSLSIFTWEDDFFKDSQVNYVTVEEFWNALNFPGLKPKDSSILKHGRIHFSHWKEAEGDLGPHTVLQFFIRGAAIICTQRALDFLVPVFLDTPENRQTLNDMKLTAGRLRRKDLTENQWLKVKRCFSYIGIKVKRDSKSVDNSNEFLVQSEKMIAKVSTNPGYFLCMQMSGKDDDEIEFASEKPSVEKGCFAGESDKNDPNSVPKESQANSMRPGSCFVKRTGLEKWELGPEEELVNDLLMYNSPPSSTRNCKFDLGAKFEKF